MKSSTQICKSFEVHIKFFTNSDADGPKHQASSTQTSIEERVNDIFDGVGAYILRPFQIKNLHFTVWGPVCIIKLIMICQSETDVDDSHYPCSLRSCIAIGQSHSTNTK